MKKEIIKVDVTKLMEQLEGKFHEQNREVLKAGARAFVKEVIDNWQDYKDRNALPTWFRDYVKQLAGNRVVWVYDEDPARLEVIIGRLTLQEARKFPTVRVLNAISNIQERGERLTLESLGREMGLGNENNRHGSSRANQASKYLVDHDLKEMFKRAQLPVNRTAKKKKGNSTE